MRREYFRGARIRVRAHMAVLGGGYRGKFGYITEIRGAYSPRPFIIATLDDGEIIGLHPEDFSIVK